MNADGFDTSAAERLLRIPPVPITAEPDLNGRDSGTLASFHSPTCNCGRSYGITYDLPRILRSGESPNEVMLHELTHALQCHRDPENVDERHMLERAVFGYYNSPHEREARKVAAELHAAGVQVWFPERARLAESERLMRTADRLAAFANSAVFAH